MGADAVHRRHACRYQGRSGDTLRFHELMQQQAWREPRAGVSVWLLLRYGADCIAGPARQPGDVLDAAGCTPSAHKEPEQLQTATYPPALFEAEPNRSGERLDRFLKDAQLLG